MTDNQICICSLAPKLLCNKVQEQTQSFITGSNVDKTVNTPALGMSQSSLIMSAVGVIGS